MMDVGRVCTKIAGRDAGKKCVITEIIDDKYVMVDGECRARRVNINHLEPLDLVLKVNKSMSKEDIISAMKEAGLKLKERKRNQKELKQNKK